MKMVGCSFERERERVPLPYLLLLRQEGKDRKKAPAFAKNGSSFAHSVLAG